MIGLLSVHGIDGADKKLQQMRLSGGNLGHLAAKDKSYLIRFAAKHGLAEVTNESKGIPDLVSLGSVAAELAAEGVIVYVKLPNQEVDAAAMPWAASLQPRDLLIAFTTPLNMRLLARYGRIVLVDGPHAVVPYGLVKLVTVMVVSCEDEHESTVTERGFAVAHFIVNSEAQRVHEAIF